MMTVTFLFYVSIEKVDKKSIFKNGIKEYIESFS